MEYKPNPRAMTWHPICGEVFGGGLHEMKEKCRKYCRILGYASMLSCSSDGAMGFGVGTGVMYSIVNETYIRPMPNCDPRQAASLRCIDGENKFNQI